MESIELEVFKGTSYSTLHTTSKIKKIIGSLVFRSIVGIINLYKLLLNLKTPVLFFKAGNLFGKHAEKQHHLRKIRCGGEGSMNLVCLVPCLCKCNYFQCKYLSVCTIRIYANNMLSFLLPIVRLLLKNTCN